MNWDVFTTGSNDDTAFVAKGDEQMCPDGTHVGTIGWAKVQTKPWAITEPANPKGMCLTIRIDLKKGIKSVFENIPCHRRGSIEAVCRSARVEPPAGDWDEQTLVGKTVTIDTVIALSKQGHDYVKIERFKPGADPLPAEVKARPARTQTQKADAAAANTDDIPF